MMNSPAQQEMIDKLQKALLKEVEFIREHTDKTLDEKVEQVDILFDVVKFLGNYKENVKILNQHLKDRDSNQL